MLHANLPSIFMQLQNSAAQTAHASALQASQAFAQLSVGQAVSATIAGRLSAGLYLADIVGQRLEMTMPVSVNPGETVSLRVLQIEPDPTFEFLGKTGSAAPTLLLSQAAQLIQTVLAGATPTPIKSAAPLVEPSALTAPIGPEQLAGVLRREIEDSGVFYESHLAAWTQGQRPLIQLQREPQAKWNTLQNLSSYPPGAAAAEIGWHAENDIQVRLGRGDDSVPRTIELPEQARPLLRQQLETLETGKIIWSGEVWHGQTAAIVIAEETPPQREQDSEPPSWRTNLALELPKLGDIRADLAVRGQMLTISIACDAKESASTLQSELTGLGKSLRAAGLQPLSLTVTGDA